MRSWSAVDLEGIKRMAEVDGKSAREIAVVLGVSKSAVSNAARRAGVRLPGGQLPNTPAPSHPYRRFDLRI